MGEILKAYRDDEGRLGRARKIVYGQGQRAGADCVEKLVREINLEQSIAWGKVQSLLPRAEPATPEELSRFPLYVEVFKKKDLFGSLKERAKLIDLKELLDGGDDSFNRWYVSLETALVELREEIERRGGAES